MAENTKETTTEKSSTTTGKAVTEGAGVTTGSSNDAVKTVAGGLAVAAPTDAKPGEPQAGSLGAPDTQNAQVEAPKNAGYPFKFLVDNHTHAGQPVKNGATIMLDMAEYRWALENKLGVPGNADDAGLDIDEAGVVIKPENEKSLEELEAEAVKAAESSDKTAEAAEPAE